MEEIYCPRCREPIGFPFMKCPDCRWYASGDQIIEGKKNALRYIEEDVGHEDQDRMVLETVLEEVDHRERTETERKMKEYRNLSKYTFGRYMKLNIIFLILPYVILITSVIFGGPADISPLLDNPLIMVLGCSVLSAIFIGANTLLFFLAKTKLFFLNRSN